MTTTAPDLETLVPRVAAYTTGMDLESEDWQRAVAVNGLLAADERVEAARRWVDRAIETQTGEGMFAYGYGDYPKEWADWTEYDVSTYKPTANPAAMGTSVLDFYERTGDDRYLDAARRQYEFLLDCERTAEGGITRRADRIELFTETIYFAAPWFVRYGRLADEPAAIEEAVRQIEVHVKRLQDPYTGLFRHIWRETPDSYPQSAYWSRGNGWALAGLLDTYLALPEDHPGRETAREPFERAATAIADAQDDTGFWHQGVDDPQSPLETSGTLTAVYALERGADEGLLPDRYAAVAERGMDACRGVVSEDGAVRRVSRPPASARSPLGVTPYGQGWFLMAAASVR